MTDFPKYVVEFTATSLFSPAIYDFRWHEPGIEPELLTITNKILIIRVLISFTVMPERRESLII